MSVVTVGDRVKETTAVTANSNVTLLGAQPGYISFYQSLGSTLGDIYYIISSPGGTEWEIGKSTLLTSTTFARTNANVLASSASPTPGTRQSFSPGIKDVYSAPPAALLQYSIPTVPSIAALRALDFRHCPGDTVNVLSWNDGTFVGGGLFTYKSSDTTSADDHGTIIRDSTAGNRRFYRVYDNVVSPYMFGAQSGLAVDQGAFLNDMHAAINANPNIVGADVSGTWYTNGGLTPLTKNDLHYFAAGRGQFIRLTAATVLSFTGTGLKSRFIDVDGNGLDNSCISIGGNDPTLFMVRGYNTNPITGGQGISIVAGVTGYQLVMCEGHDTGKGGIGPGKATKGIIALSRVYNTGAEGIPGDELSHCILLANIGHDTKGIGFLGMDRALNVIAVANLGYNNNNGFSCGDNKGDSQNLMVSSNIFVDNDHCGIWFKNKYARATITNITAPGVAPCVVTYQSLPVTGVSNALPCVMLVVGHGKTDGDRVIHHNIGGAGLGAALNNIEFCIKKIDNDHYYLLDTETLEPFDSTASGAYTAATGQMDHPFAHDDRQRLTGVTGMIQINYNPLTFLPQIQVGVATNTTVTLVNEDGTPFDTSLFTAYAGGGITERGGTAFNSGIHNNIVDGNNDYEIHTGWCQPQRVGNNLTVTGNQGPVAKNNFEGTPDHNGLNRNLDFDAGLTATKNNVTGDGTPYTIQFDQQYDNAGSYDPLTGIYLVQQDGHHWFETSVGITGIAGAATGKVEIQFYDRFGVLARTFRGNLAPNLGATEWRANVAGTMVLFRNMTVKVVITVTGLGLVGDMVSDGTSTFQGGLLH